MSSACSPSDIFRPMCRRRLALALALLLAACGGSTSRTDPSPPPPPAAAPDAGATPVEPDPEAEREAEIERLADDLIARAAAHEPAVSKLLQEVAGKVGGQMAGFEHRLKKRDSLVRKINTVLKATPGLAVSGVVINDALRYTLQVDDTPPGRHVEAIRTALGALEGAGHKVLKVKNYWPRGDNYSGVNSVLETPDGLQWELQFHTAESFRIQHRDHELYEEMRKDDTPVATRREIYKKLAAPWEKVPIPRDMLKPNALHQQEEIISRPPP
jgi:hypothetical protein